jgi:glycosyltransferase involved in cell wall biosynthesis
LALNWRCLRHPEVGGSEINLFEQARQWVQQGHAVTVLCADPGRNHAPQRTEVLDGITVRRMGGRFSVYLHAAHFLLAHGQEFDYIVDVANGIPFFTPLFTDTPGALLVHHVHGQQWYSEFPRPLATIGWFLERRVVPRVYRHRPVIAVSPTTRDALLPLGFDADAVHIVYNGVAQPAAAEPAAAPEPHRIAYVGRLKRYKRIELLIQAVAQLRTEFPDLHLDLAGDGDARADLEALIVRLGLQAQVTVHGFVDDATKARILSSAAVFATPSMHEGWGLSVIEANAAGCPAVAYDVPGLRVAIRHEETGLLAADDAGFRAALATILRSQPVRDRLAAGARRWAASFSWEASAAATVQILERGVPARALPTTQGAMLATGAV